MASPISFGDAYLMSQLAWKIAQAFTTGRKSAPAGFREVENQLYSLSSALVAIKNASEQGILSMSQSSGVTSGVIEDDTIKSILTSCQGTLKHLEGIVEKYSAVVEAKEPQQPLTRRWRDSIVKDFKKIAWTTESGDLTTLRSHLVIHTNSLDLVLGVLLNTRTTRIENAVEDNTRLLKEVHDLLRLGLKSPTALAVSPATTDSPITFELYLETDESQDLICGEACLSQSWQDKSEDDLLQSSLSLFKCCCYENQLEGGWGHKARVTDFKVSDLTFPYQRLGNRCSWVLFKTADTSSNLLVSLTIQNVSIEHIAEFQNIFISPLSSLRADIMLQHGMSTMIAYMDTDTQRKHVLNMKSELSQSHNFIQTVSFSVGPRSYKRDHVAGITLLHYKCSNSRLSGSDALLEASASMCDFADLILYYDDDSDKQDITRSIVQIRQRTRLTVQDEGTTVTLFGVKCLGYMRDIQAWTMDDMNVTFNFINPDACNNFFEQIEEMRMALWIWSLQFPQANEETLLHLQAAQVHSDRFLIPAAEIYLVRTPSANVRLIIVSKNNCTIVSQLLPTVTPDSTSVNPTSFASEAWLVQLHDSGKRNVYQLKNGFKYLRFQNTESKSMLEWGQNVSSDGREKAIDTA